MPVTARRLIRKMRGGAQAHLIEADDGHSYVVKFRNNPQHRRILVNEWITSTFLQYLQITAPKYSIVKLGEDFLQDTPEIYIQMGQRRDAVTPGWHFGSRYPGDPQKTAVYDFVPDSMLAKVANLSEFLGTLAVDKWLSNTDARQAVFIRAKLREYSPAYADHPLRIGFVALMIDHGYMFNGPHWEYPDSPVSGVYFRPLVYQGARSLDDFQPWLDRIHSFPEEVVDDALRQLPTEWLNGDASALDKLLEKLMRRRGRVSDLLLECIRRKSEWFPHWSGTR